MNRRRQLQFVKHLCCAFMNRVRRNAVKDFLSCIRGFRPRRVGLGCAKVVFGRALGYQMSLLPRIRGRRWPAGRMRGLLRLAACEQIPLALTLSPKSFAVARPHFPKRASSCSVTLRRARANIGVLQGLSAFHQRSLAVQTLLPPAFCPIQTQLLFRSKLNVPPDVATVASNFD
jgi:hypothetical protein